MFTLCKQRDQPRVRSRREPSSSQTRMFGKGEPTTRLRVHVTEDLKCSERLHV